MHSILYYCKFFNLDLSNMYNIIGFILLQGGMCMQSSPVLCHFVIAKNREWLVWDIIK